MGQRYAQTGEGMRWEWDVEPLWALARDLPVQEIPIEQIVGLDQVTWFSPDGDQPTVRAIAMHAKRIRDCDLSYPVLLTEDGRVFDGMHRIARHLVDGRATIRAQQFAVNPPPDRVIVLGGGGAVSDAG